MTFSLREGEHMKKKHKAWAVGVPGDLLRRQGQLYPEIHDNRATARRVRNQMLPFWPPGLEDILVTYQ